jgi:HAMP domain-containing protein
MGSAAADVFQTMAGNLTNQVRAISTVAKAVAAGDMTKTVEVESQGEMLELNNTLNTMVYQLSEVSSEVSRVALEVGTKGILGGQASVPGVRGTWADLTNNVNVRCARPDHAPSAALTRARRRWPGT